MTALKVAASAGLFVACLTLGWWLGHRGLLSQSRASHITRLLIKYPSPLILCLTLWELAFSTGHLWVLPVIGFLVSLSMLVPAWWYARWARLSAPQTGSMLTCALFSNLGYLGAFTAFALFGEAGYGLCMLYTLFFSPVFYTLGFWIASHFGHRADRHLPNPLEDESKFYPILGMLVGVILNVLHVPRPHVLSVINQMLIPATTILSLTAIGSHMESTFFSILILYCFYRYSF